MLLIGEHELGGLPGISDEEGRTQFGMWSLLAAPLIMGSKPHILARATPMLVGAPTAAARARARAQNDAPLVH